MKLAAVTFSPQGLTLCRRLQEGLAELQIYLHDSVAGGPAEHRFRRIMELTPQTVWGL